MLRLGVLYPRSLDVYLMHLSLYFCSHIDRCRVMAPLSRQRCWISTVYWSQHRRESPIPWSGYICKFCMSTTTLTRPWFFCKYLTHVLFLCGTILFTVDSKDYVQSPDASWIPRGHPIIDTYFDWEGTWELEEDWVPPFCVHNWFPSLLFFLTDLPKVEDLPTVPFAHPDIMEAYSSGEQQPAGHPSVSVLVSRPEYLVHMRDIISRCIANPLLALSSSCKILFPRDIPMWKPFY